jgi:DNA phosphorothioation-dependent restriction protein DptG
LKKFNLVMETYINVEEDLKGYFVLDQDGSIKEFKHRQPSKILLFPYNTKMEPNLGKVLKQDLKNFDGYVGKCNRMVLQKDFSNELKSAKNYGEHLKQTVLENIVAQTKTEPLLQDKLRAIVDSLYFDELNLVKYGPQAQRYLNWATPNNTLDKTAAFIKAVFMDQELEELFTAHDVQEEHILNQLVNNSLPALKAYDYTLPNYHVLDQDVVRLFKKDLLYLSSNKKSFLNDVEKLFKFYYFFYISRAVFRLNDFFSPQVHPLYFTLEEETFSESRRAYDAGWRQLEPKISHLFSHAICMDLLNHLDLRGSNKTYDYVALKEYYKELDESAKESLILAVRGISEVYQRYVPDVEDDWQNFDEQFISSLNRRKITDAFEVEVYKLWFMIEYQFEHSGRKKPKGNYANWFIFFCRENFLKYRGRNGSSLSLNHSMLLFLTKLCIGDHSKIRLKDLWLAYKERGISFDDASQQAIIELFEKINLLEKKSDSGDAQYVKAIL